jgi:hypothetical protein
MQIKKLVFLEMLGEIFFCLDSMGLNQNVLAL